MTNNGSPPRGAREVRTAQELFARRLAKVCDGSVYTVPRLQELFGLKKTMADEFVRKCKTHPNVVVRVQKIHQKHSQYTFEMVTHGVSDRVKQLAQEIASDPNAGGRAKAAADKILVLLGA